MLSSLLQSACSTGSGNCTSEHSKGFSHLAASQQDLQAVELGVGMAGGAPKWDVLLPTSGTSCSRMRVEHAEPLSWSVLGLLSAAGGPCSSQSRSRVKLTSVIQMGFPGNAALTEVTRLVTSSHSHLQHKGILKVQAPANCTCSGPQECCVRIRRQPAASWAWGLSTAVPARPSTVLPLSMRLLPWHAGDASSMCYQQIRQPIGGPLVDTHIQLVPSTDQAAPEVAHW